MNINVMRKVEQNMLQAALVSWGVTYVMDKLFVIVPSIRNLTWEKLAVGMFGNQPHLKYALLRGSALTTSHSAILLSELRCRKCTSRIYRMKEAA